MIGLFAFCGMYFSLVFLHAVMASPGLRAVSVAIDVCAFLAMVLVILWLTEDRRE